MPRIVLPRQLEELPDALRRTIERQHGAVATEQLRSWGMSTGEVRSRRSQGHLRQVLPGVEVVVGSPASWRQMAWAVTLMPVGPVLTSTTALRAHQVDGFEDQRTFHVMVARGARLHVPDRVVVHSSRRWFPDTAVSSHGLRCSDPLTSLVLAPPHAPRWRLQRGLDHLLRNGTEPEALRRVVEHWRGSGVDGSGVVGRLLTAQIGAPLPRSWFERLAGRLLARTGLRLVHEYPVTLADGRSVIIDLAAPEVKVGVECQSIRHHAAPQEIRRDERRRLDLRAVDWELVMVWWDDLRRIDRVMRDVVVAVERQRRVMAPR